MTENTTSDPAESTAIDSLTDPARLADEDDVDHCTSEFPHESEDHCEAGVAGRAIVGVVNDADELLLRVHDEEEMLVLPNATVHQGDDWVAGAERAVAEKTGLDVDVEGVERVRRAEHVVDGEETPFQTTTHVVFRAAPAGDATEVGDPDDADDWSVDWFDALPEGFGACGGPAVDDARLFLE
ncbi:NUDIX hydrolase [Halomicrococcus sp. SG-WS-1]|uniref:NUDIX hydrolase n=1 Tax=Halomicrococcus sp. SG-WS-1 TaxID=3439057 RepID=UPI003F7A129E